ncbi:MAG: SDR family oxidoreductase [Clostridiales bacterium]|nr:SDR family oxidoreductase [Clostridiales bacterium]
MKKVMIITGGSSGIGLAAARLFYEKGYTVYDFSRSGKDDGGIHHIDVDVCDESAVRSAVSRVMEQSGQIDLLINNAGYGISGPVEGTHTEDAKGLFEVNFFGNLNCTKAVLPHMRKRGKGRIINISSVAAELSIPFQSFYSASKSAVSALTLALRSEVKPFGITVCAAMPGDVKTGFTVNRQKDDDTSGAYTERLCRSIGTMERDEQTGMAPEYIAKRLYAISQKKRVRPLYTLGPKYRLFTFMAKVLPKSLACAIVGSIYAK